MRISDWSSDVCSSDLNVLCGALLCALAFSGVVAAQEFDDRWYASAGTSLWNLDHDRDTSDVAFGLQFGAGRFFTRNFSLDAEFNYMNPQKNNNDLDRKSTRLNSSH